MRESSALLTSKYGFSVVAPISVTSPSSTAGQQRVLLRLVEAVDLVEEEDRRAAAGAPLAGAGDHLAHLGAAGLHGGQLLEGGVGVLGGEPRERRLAGARRAVEHHRVRLAGLERRAQRRALAEQVLLADELVERLRAHARRQRPVGRRPVIRAFLGRVEQPLHTSIFAQRCGQAPLSTVIREWGRMGALSFGGPPVQVAMLRDLTVERRRWLDAREFEDANAAVQLIPGPAGTQLAIYCAMRVGGTAGAILGGLAFILPGLLLILAISALALADSPPEWILGIGAGAAAAVVAVVAQAGIVLTRSSLEHGATAAARDRLRRRRRGRRPCFAGAGLVLALLACGFVELAWRRRPGAAVHAWPVALILAVTGAAALPALAWTALKVGALSYGGGFVIIPLMQEDAVEHVRLDDVRGVRQRRRLRPAHARARWCRRWRSSAGRRPGSAARCSPRSSPSRRRSW